MNKKQKVLTIVALIAFLVIAACHYLEFHAHGDYGGPYIVIADSRWVDERILPDPKMSWFILGVTYAGLFFVLQDKRPSAR